MAGSEGLISAIGKGLQARHDALRTRTRSIVLHGNAKRIIQLVQLVLSVRLPWPTPPREQTPMLCPRCGEVLQLLMVRQRERMPIRC